MGDLSRHNMVNEVWTKLHSREFQREKMGLYSDTTMIGDYTNILEFTLNMLDEMDLETLIEQFDAIVE